MRTRRMLCTILGFVVVCAVTGGAICGLSLPQSFSHSEDIDWNRICSNAPPECPSSYQGHTPPLLLVSLDGFRAEYLQRGLTPTLQTMRECGASAEAMYSVFPTKTFPNHFSQVTGLYPSSHGIVDNKMFDPSTGRFFKVGNPESLNPDWWEAEPLWVTADKQGKRTATYFWPGADVAINGSYPTHYFPYNQSVPFETRVDQIVQWLSLPSSSRPHFLTLYFDQPDSSAHAFGFHSAQVNESLSRVDAMLQRLLLGLQAKNLSHCVNIFVVSDHGMANSNCERAIILRDYYDVNETYAIDGLFARIRPKSNDTGAVDGLLSKLRCSFDHARVYRKQELPVRYHYADHPRIEPVFVDPEVGWHLDKEPKEWEYNQCKTYGTHGYDNLVPDMRATFTAVGPSIKRNFTIPPFINIELYNLMCELIGVVPNPNNGTHGSLSPVLWANPPPEGLLPLNETEHRLRVEASRCPCTQTHKLGVEVDVNQENSRHLPFGFPLSPRDKHLRLLYNEDYVVAFDTVLRMPAWATFTIDFSNTTYKPEDPVEVCWRGDARIPEDEAQRCLDPATLTSDLKILQRPLYPPAFSANSTVEEAFLVTNSVPKSLFHSREMEPLLQTTLARWSSARGQVNVVTGPAFDVHATGLRPPDQDILESAASTHDIPVHTHLFVVATWCSRQSVDLRHCRNSDVSALSFLLPNRPYPRDCKSVESVLEKNVARTVDVENLSGLAFFTDLPPEDAIRLRTSIPTLAIEQNFS